MLAPDPTTGERLIKTQPLPTSVASKTSPHRWLLRCCACAVALLALAVVLEVIGRVAVKLAGIPTKFEPARFREFGQTDPLLWWTLAPNLDVETQGVRIRTNELGFRDPRDELPAGTPTIFCLGDSTTYGWRVAADEMYTAVAESLVREQSGRSQRAEIVSAGVPGYTSFQCLVQLREKILPLRPTVVVVLASNNECRSRSMGDRERGQRLSRRQALDRLLGFSHFWILLSRGPESLARSWELDAPPGRVANESDEYRENLRELIRLARESGVKVVVMTVPLRPRFEPTWKTFDEPSDAVATLLRRAQQAALAGDSLDAQAALLEDATEQQPNQFTGHWRLAQVYSALGRVHDADREYRLAREGDLHPEAAKHSYNMILAELGEAEAVTLVDLDRQFAESGRRDDELFLDHCHPSAAGHRLIGAALAKQISPMLNDDRPNDAAAKE